MSNFIEDAKAKYGEMINDAVVIENRGGETTTTTIMHFGGKKISTIEVNPEKIEM